MVKEEIQAFKDEFENETLTKTEQETYDSVLGELGVKRNAVGMQLMGTDIEMLVVGNCLLRKEDQDTELRMNYSEAFELD